MAQQPRALVHPALPEPQVVQQTLLALQAPPGERVLLGEKATLEIVVALVLLPRPKALDLEQRLHRTLHHTRLHRPELYPRRMLLASYTSLKPCYNSW